MLRVATALAHPSTSPPLPTQSRAPFRPTASLSCPLPPLFYNISSSTTLHSAVKADVYTDFLITLLHTKIIGLILASEIYSSTGWSPGNLVPLLHSSHCPWNLSFKMRHHIYF